jgi:hypothetical protein
MGAAFALQIGNKQARRGVAWVRNGSAATAELSPPFTPGGRGCAERRKSGEI